MIGAAAKELVCSFVLVAYNSEDVIGDCLRSISRHTRSAFEVIVVDNSPGLETAHAVASFCAADPAFPVRLTRPVENLGFAKACNAGAREATGTYLLFLNPDTQLLNDVVTELIAGLGRHPGSEMVGPAIFGSSGTIARTCRNLPTLRRISLDAAGLDRHLGTYRLSVGEHQRERSVEQIIGAAMLLRRSTYERMGGMDEQFFIYFEEVDLCKRLQDEGGEIWFCPQARVQHLAGKSCEVDTVRARMIAIFRESRQAYFRKHQGSRGALAAGAVNRLEGLGKAAVFAFLWFATHKPAYKEKAAGFWSVAKGMPSGTGRPPIFRVLAFTVKPYESADTRYRILQYQAIAERQGIRIEHRSLMGATYYRWQIRNKHLLLRLALYPVLFSVRLWQAFVLAPRYGAVWISREMTPIGPPVLERLVTWRCKRVIFDVDDALHLSDKEGSRLLLRLLRDHGKFSRMAARYDEVVCGNSFLAQFYGAKSSRVHTIPTVVEADRYATVKPCAQPTLRIGWVGTPLNRHHLASVQPALQQLSRERSFELVTVGLNEPLNWDMPGLRHIPWDTSKELEFFGSFHIGIMPVEDSPFAQGKCAFKLIQYMAAGLPVVASPVGANCDVVEHGRNGLLAASQEDWVAALRLLLDDADLRQRMGACGRSLVRQRYSVEAVWPRYAGILTGAS